MGYLSFKYCKFTNIILTCSQNYNMNRQQYELLKKLITQTTEEEFQKDKLTIFKYDGSEEITVLLLKKYRQEINAEIRKKFPLNEEELEACFFKVLDSFCRSVKENRFRHDSENSVKNYLFKGCEGAAKRFLGNKQKTPNITVEEFLKFQYDIEEDIYEKEVEHANMVKAMYAALEELPTGCNEIIRKYHLEEKSHAEIVKLIPQLLNVKNSSAKANRCLDKLKIKTLNIYKKLENVNHNLL